MPPVTPTRTRATDALCPLWRAVQSSAMFTVEERDAVRSRVLELAEADPDVAAAAITGSYVTGGADEWSDVDVAFGIRGDVGAALERWADILERDFGAI